MTHAIVLYWNSMEKYLYLFKVTTILIIYIDYVRSLE